MPGARSDGGIGTVENVAYASGRQSSVHLQIEIDVDKCVEIALGQSRRKTRQNRTPLLPTRGGLGEWEDLHLAPLRDGR